MDSTLRAPRNRTGELQLILRLVEQGYWYWVSDTIPADKLEKFARKWERYRLLADPAARAWRKKTKRANTHLVLSAQFNEPDCLNSHTSLPWLMLGTEGKDGLLDDLPKPGIVHDARKQGEHLVWGDYELLRQNKRYQTADGRLKTETTWTWRIKAQRWREWEALVIAAQKARDAYTLKKTFAMLSALPLFAGVRQQILRLHQEVNKLGGKIGGVKLPQLNLPFTTLTKIWG